MDRQLGVLDKASLAMVLCCPICSQKFREGQDLVCGNGHHFPVVGGIPRLVVDSWESGASQIVRASSEAFGVQWTELGEDAQVTLDDLVMHLPSHWTQSIFSGLVLDAGCGMGRYAALAQELGANVVGMDVSNAVDKGAALWPDISFVQADIGLPPLEKQSFDLVFSLGVLHHLPDSIRGLRMCFDLVRPGGRLLVWTYSAHGGLFRNGRRMLRPVVALLPWARKPMAWGSAALIYSAYLLPQKWLRRRIRRLSFYRDKKFSQLYVDCHDALVAPQEAYLDADDCSTWLASLDAAQSGFEQRRDGSGWIIWAEKAGA